LVVDTRSIGNIYNRDSREMIKKVWSRLMSVIDELRIIEKLDNSDQEKIRYFLRLLISKDKYKKLRQEIEERRKEIVKGEVLTHNEIWQQLNV